ncbi:response regulator transcription factor [Lentzea sp. PSKA42]|uniref:Sensory transduction protein RegX3 n=1 Tax=Lentzea indica TaxID=2604800 RepID=A0ABX1FRT0_9PSEU|nr:response regulator transcription factor [Lentzea indica]NKE61445.1 response regulator transcription factor [Lentzea indica]
MRVLLVEDDDRVAHALVPILVRNGCAVHRQASGRDVIGLLDGFDVVLLDLGLPDVDGLVLCRRIRAAGSVAIIVVSARREIDNRVQALYAGADDYLAKPFDVGELVARMHTVRRRRRRPEACDAGVLEAADIRIDQARKEVTVAGVPVTLTPKEFRLLKAMMAAGGAVCTRQRLLDAVWGRSWAGANRTLEVHIATLRTKLGRPDILVTVRGVGYRLGVRHSGSQKPVHPQPLANRPTVQGSDVTVIAS